MIYNDSEETKIFYIYKLKMSSKMSSKRLKKRVSKRKQSTLKTISMTLLFFALLSGWIYANYLLITKQIYPTMIVPTAVNIAKRIIIDNNKKSIMPADIAKSTDIVALLSILLLTYSTSKTSRKTSYNEIISFILAAWAFWINKKNGDKTSGLTDQELVKYTIEFAGIMSIILGLPSAEIYAFSRLSR